MCVCVCPQPVAFFGVQACPGAWGGGLGEMCSSMLFKPVLHASFWSDNFFFCLLLQITASDFVDAALG